ncbi:hypothetical protein [Chelativorans salis]|uniref:Uncharacterized protein n=1 Tax=Chelativorans salis TaxID=2978478 RepID=A0ABT2LRG4_9HYPH|nr:hypothetical protein [Chelativorans sp. EGI FJ00035]MCT7377137.1 hypothetical protein [Chelativorans sp. EGI FJ00035]
MKMTVQPGKRPGLPKALFAGELQLSDIEVNEADAVTVTFIGDDIYTPRATQRFSITFSKHEIQMIVKAMVLD